MSAAYVKRPPVVVVSLPKYELGYMVNATHELSVDDARKLWVDLNAALEEADKA